MNDDRPRPDHKWNADRPGERPEEDALGRKDFAQQVAKELRGWRQKASLVVSLNGDWGSGKTTLANLILHYLRAQAAAANEKPPIVVHFNPWQWSGQDKLLEGFFAEVGAAFRGGGIGDKATAKRLARFWEGLRLATVAGGEIAQRLQESLTVLAASLAAGSGVLSSYVESPAGKEFLSWASVVLLGLAGACAVCAPIAEKLAAMFEWGKEKDRPALDKVRADLRSELAKLESSVLVVVDDIDRLTKREMRLLVQLVKANADFPNVVYLLLYQKSILADALGEVTCEKGQDFLKKIVQVELEVPMAPEHEMRRFFTDQINPVLSRAEIRWEKERWGDLFDEGIWPYFRTPRDIKRFMGVLDFYFEAHVIEGVLEVNPIDLIMLETLRMFDPEAYEAVGRAFQKQRDFILERLFNEKGAKDRLSLGINALLERPGLSEPERGRLKVLLFGLFPQARDSFSMSDREDQDWERHRRICHPKFFRRYFQLRSDPGDITAAFISKLFRSGNDRDAIRKLLQHTFDAGNFVPLMERLNAVREDLPAQLIEPLVTALFDLSDGLPEVKEEIFFMSSEQHLTRVVAMLLYRVEDQAVRAATLRRAALASEAVTGPVSCLSLLQPDAEDRKMNRPAIVDPAELKSIADELLPRLWATAREGRIWKLRKAALLIYRLRDWAGIEPVRAWLSEVIQDPTVAVAFLRTMLNESHVSGGRTNRTVYTLLGTALEKFVDLEKLAECAELAANDVLEKAAVTKLREAISRKNDAKPYLEIYVLSRDESGNFLTDHSDASL